MSEPLDPASHLPEGTPEPNSQGYDVGYGKPPIGTRFKKGQSGNLKGRPKLRRSMQAEINRELKQKLTINEHGRQKKITKQQAIAKRLVNDAINGKNNRFIWSYLFQREEELHGTITPEGKTAREQLDDFIQKAKARQLARKQAEND